MKIFLRWELDLYLNYLGYSPRALNMDVHIFNFMVNQKMDVTVNEMRAILNFPAHPDPVRGAMYIWEVETPQPGDDVIPDPVKAQYGIP